MCVCVLKKKDQICVCVLKKKDQIIFAVTTVSVTTFSKDS